MCIWQHLIVRILGNHLDRCVDSKDTYETLRDIGNRSFSEALQHYTSLILDGDGNSLYSVFWCDCHLAIWHNLNAKVTTMQNIILLFSLHHF